ncbi:3-deoxy-7-phosphoheptulonate synthase [bacterium]|nr:3-deoxy-7-phosphoheptulonate synthase [bacterium]
MAKVELITIVIFDVDVVMLLNEWTTNSWQKYKCLQMPFYPYLSPEVQRVSSQLDALPALVYIEEINQLKAKLLQLSARQSFLLHGGTCAETFDHSTVDYVTRQTHMLQLLALQMEAMLLKPVIKIARLAGQFGKPRTSMMQGDMLSYFGDIVNQVTACVAQRKPQPENMLHAYHHSKKMISFMHENACFLSHEAFLLPYESALTRQQASSSGWYNLTTHFLWLGKRSLYLNSPHIEYIRGIHNPIGIKLSEDMSPDFLVHLIQYLNPTNEVARIGLIHRFGADRIEECLPNYIQALQKAKLDVIWIVDPMHGNTESLSDGRKYRNTQKILRESVLAAEIHAQHDSYLAGLHLECTNEAILECAAHPADIDLSLAYTSVMDPRLNLEQASDLVQVFAKHVSNIRK